MSEGSTAKLRQPNAEFHVDCGRRPAVDVNPRAQITDCDACCASHVSTLAGCKE
jgi:hypothetical protein